MIQKKSKVKQKVKSKKLPSLCRLRRLADRLWSLKVKTAYNGKCAVCESSTDTLNSHHIEPRTANAVLRWEPLDGICLCVSHHKYGKDAAHKSSIFFYEFIKDKIPKVIEYIRPLRAIELKAGSVNRNQIEIVLAFLWSEISTKESEIWDFCSIEELNSRWSQARKDMPLTVWEREYLESLHRPQEPIWPAL